MEQPEPTNVVIFWGEQPYWLTQQKGKVALRSLIAP